MKLIFAYERGLRGPAPVVFHGGIPTTNGKQTFLLASHDVTDRPEFFTSDGSPMFGALIEAFPPPVVQAA